jgi:FtsP/CotA-like multicopper oxidase with cupredoxin domain
VPGPTIEADRGQPLTVEWRNELGGGLPVVVTIAPEPTDATGVPVQCVPGLSGGTPDERAAALSGHTVVHLHGGLTPAPYDGWAENLFAPGQRAIYHYPMDQRAALLWCHDHVMGVTKFDVYAGLAGLWIIRDDRETELGLPEGPPFELPLLIQDRNFDLDPEGRLTGRLVHKTDPEVMEAFAPFTTVNGKVWPVLDLRPGTHRFRVVNGSNARTYRLVIVRDGKPDLDRMTQIGTDQGLLRAPTCVPPDGLLLASAERADVLLDISHLEPGSELTLLNTAAAPFDGAVFPAADACDAADLDGVLPYPQVMRIRIVPGPVTRHTVPRQLARDYLPPGPARLDGAPRRTIALVERELDGSPNVLTIASSLSLPMTTGGRTSPSPTASRPPATAPSPPISRTRRHSSPSWASTRSGSSSTSPATRTPSTSTSTRSRSNSRRAIHYEIPADGIEDFSISTSMTVGRDPGDTLENAIDDNERGLKDTIRVNPNEIVEIAVRFTTYSGRYMYHCHILETKTAT